MDHSEPLHHDGFAWELVSSSEVMKEVGCACSCCRGDRNEEIRDQFSFALDLHNTTELKFVAQSFKQRLCLIIHLKGRLGSHNYHVI